MTHLKNLLNLNAYSLNKEIKDKFFIKKMNFLTLYHYKRSQLYKKYLDGLKYKIHQSNNLSSIPFLPVRLFKEFEFLSIKKNKIFKTLFSSGTTSDKLSKIYIDKTNALNQIKVLQKILYNLIGGIRLPMLIVDKEIAHIDRNNFNASVAAIKGFSIFAKEITYLLDKNNQINYENFNNFLEKNYNQKFIIFGFTDNIYNYLINKIEIKKKIIKKTSNALLIHGGGWKKIEEKKISKKIFNELLNKKLGINNITNYYGLVEQIGSIFFECKCGYFITSNYSDVIIRDENLNISKNGKMGIVQLMSLLPTSYPGHNILTEDIGEIVEDNKCNCYGHGKRFLIHGRLKNAELRGCSNIEK